jgi:hypothetical protein
MKKIAIVTFLFLHSYISQAQSVAINTTGTTANTNAILDVDVNNKGILIPRVNLVTLTTNSLTTFGISATPVLYLVPFFKQGFIIGMVLNGQNYKQL